MMEYGKKAKKIFIAGHGSSKKGSIGRVEEYILSRGDEVYMVMHPLNGDKNRHTSFTYNGSVEKLKRRNLGIANHLVDMYITVMKLLNRDVNTCIASTNIDALPLIMLRMLGLKKRVKLIYYPRDYSEGKYRLRALNRIYEIVEATAVRYSDLIISNTKRAEAKRTALGMNKNNSKIISNGIKDNFFTLADKTPNKGHFIYSGDVSKEHGLIGIINILNTSIEKLVIIGDGSEWEDTIGLCARLNIPVETHRNKDYVFVNNYLKSFEGYGLAPYTLDSKWTWYCSPLKVVEYIAHNIPVLISNVPEISEELAQKGLGIVYDFNDPGDLSSHIDGFNLSHFGKQSKIFTDSRKFSTIYGDIFHA